MRSRAVRDSASDFDLGQTGFDARECLTAANYAPASCSAIRRTWLFLYARTQPFEDRHEPVNRERDQVRIPDA
jgi:hypothetical protein